MRAAEQRPKEKGGREEVHPAHERGRPAARSRRRARLRAAHGGLLRRADRAVHRRVLPHPPARPRPHRARARAAGGRRSGAAARDTAACSSRAARAARDHRRRARAGPPLPAPSPAAGDRRGRRRHPARPVAARARRARGVARSCCRRRSRRSSDHRRRSASILFMFLVGLELEPDAAARRVAHATLAISHASIVVPFLLGAALALFLYPRCSTSDVPFTVFALFLGVVDVGHGVPGAGAHPDRPRAARARALGVDRAHLRRGRRRDRVVPARVRRRRRAVARVERARSTDRADASAYIAVMFARRAAALRAASRSAHAAGADAACCAWRLIVVALLLSPRCATEAIGIHALFGAFLARRDRSRTTACIARD